MDIPPVTDPRWGQILTGVRNPQLATLATRLLLTRLKLAVKQGAMPLPDAVWEFHHFFAANLFSHRDLPAIQECRP